MAVAGAVGQAGAVQFDVVPCFEAEQALAVFCAADIQSGHTVNGGAAVVQIAALGGAALEGDVVGFEAEQPFGFDAAAGDVDLLLGVEYDVFAADAAAVADVAGGQIDDAPAGKGTAVVDAAGFQLQGVGADESAGAVEIAGAGEYVDFGYEYALAAAVGQGNGLAFKPDDVAGQPGNLLGGQGDAGDQLLGAGEADAGVHQGLELGFVVRVAVQTAVAGQTGNLFVDQALLVIAVAQPFVGAVGIGLQGFEHVVAAQPGAVVGIGRIGFHQIAGAVGTDGVQAAFGQTEAAVGTFNARRGNGRGGGIGRGGMAGRRVQAACLILIADVVGKFAALKQGFVVYGGTVTGAASPPLSRFAFAGIAVFEDAGLDFVNAGQIA